MEKMQYCFWCNKELGIFDKSQDDLDTCGDAKCEREARRAYQDEEAEMYHRAEQDHFERYR